MTSPPSSLSYTSTLPPSVIQREMERETSSALKMAKGKKRTLRRRLKSLKKARKVLKRMREGKKREGLRKEKMRKMIWERDNSMDGGWYMTRKTWRWRKNNPRKRWENVCCDWELTLEEWRWIWWKLSRLGYEYKDRHHGRALKIGRIDTSLPFKLENMRAYFPRKGQHLEVWRWTEKEREEMKILDISS